MFLEPSAAVTGGAIALQRLVSALDRQRVRPLVVLGSAGRRFTAPSRQETAPSLRAGVTAH